MYSKKVLLTFPFGYENIISLNVQNILFFYAFSNISFHAVCNAAVCKVAKPTVNKVNVLKKICQLTNQSRAGSRKGGV